MRGFSAMIIGGLLGALVGVLVAPRPGYQTRLELKRQAREAGEQLNDAVEQGRLRATELVNWGTDQIEKTGTEVKHEVNRGIETARETIHEKTAKPMSTPGPIV